MFRRRKKNAPNIPVSSMADIAFLLLVFFMVTSVLETDPEVQIAVPEVKGGKQLKKKISNIYLSKDGAIFYNTMRVSMPEAVNYVRAKLATTPDLRVLIHADKEIEYEKVDKAFLLLREAGALKVSLVTQTAPGGE
ncbi:MAG: biopolymer transporter ExbD [Leptospiraceae bacterium]|nr:biopolymer transporter ExbD [Leptospiraceae bacterium]MCP5499528.1 biopolymer transporter ExbD [Leptospiraceae bacterium]